MTKGRQSVRRETPREFFIQIPAFLEYLSDLDPFAWRLYAHYLRVCGEVDSCYEYTATTSRLCSMSERTIRYRRQALADLNLISFWYEGRRGDERVNVIIRDVWGINAKFLRLLRTKSVGEWVEPWIHGELEKIDPIGEDALSDGKQTPAPDAGRPASKAAPPASKAAPPASYADIERSLRKIPEKDPLDNAEGDHPPIGKSDPSPTPQPPPAQLATPLIAIAEKVAEAESFDRPAAAKVVTTPPRLQARRMLQKDGPHFKQRDVGTGDHFPAGKGTNPVQIYFERFSPYEYKLSDPQQDDMMAKVKDLDLWRAVVAAWDQAGFKATNRKGMLEWYDDPNRFSSDVHKPVNEKRSQKGLTNAAHTPTEPASAVHATDNWLSRFKAGKPSV